MYCNIKTNTMAQLITKLTDADAIVVGDLLGYREEYARRKARRFYSYVKGEVKNWGYDDTIHFGNIGTSLLPALSFMIKRGYYVPHLSPKI